MIFSKGHASTLLYSVYLAAGVISDEELLRTASSEAGSRGTPRPSFPGSTSPPARSVRVLPIGVGTALAAKRLDRVAAHTWVLCGDSEMAEGSMWEAFEHAAHYELDNLTAILDVNRLGQRGETMVGWDLDVYVARARAFGWHAIAIDGHDVEEIDRAFTEALATTGTPTVIVARTVKGKGVAAVEDENGFHGKPLDDVEAAIAELGGRREIRIEIGKPEPGEPHRFPTTKLELPRYELGEEVATRKAYGEALAALGSARGDVVALDGEVSNSTFAEIFKQAHPERFFEMYIAEQQMVATAVGLQIVGWRPFVSTFAAFLSRAYDFVRMAAVSRARFAVSGSHAGVSIGEDGPSQMGLEDIAMFRAIHGSVVLHPCDGNQTAKLVQAMADVEGIAYIRTLRPATPVIYGPEEEFEIGGSSTLRSSDEDEVALVAAGITVPEALKAADRLSEDGIAARVIDLYSIKPIDAEALRAAAEATQGRIVTVEDHWPEGGLGDAVLAALCELDQPPRVVKLAVQGMPSSGTAEELLAAAGIDADHVVAAASKLVRQTVQTA